MRQCVEETAPVRSGRSPCGEPRLLTSGFRRGLRTTMPLALGNVAFGVTFGALATSAGLSGGDAVVMSVAVFSGTAQILALEMMSGRASVVAIWGATLLVSLRYILMGLTMRSWFAGVSRRIVAPGMYFLSDQSWALTLMDRHRGGREPGFFLGSNVALAATWIGGTALGAAAGGLVADPERWGIHFAATAAFIGILGGMQRTRADLVPWAVAVGVAIGTERLLGGHWHLFLGVMAGLLAGSLSRRASDG